MDIPGIKNLGDFAITTAGTFESDWVETCEGIDQLDVQMLFAYGSGGTGIKAYLQTSLDEGETAIDLWCFTATTVAKTRARSLAPSSTEITPGDGALADDTVAAGIVLGDRFRVKLVVTGTYAGNTGLTVRGAAR